MDKVPQYSDIIINFLNITYNIDPENEIDLSSVDDIILSISRSSASSDPIVVLNYATSPSYFTIDNDEKSVSVKLTSSQVGQETGKYYVNLWIESLSRYVTHLTKSFEVEKAVRHTE